MAGQGITGLGDLTQDVVDAIEGGGSPLTTKGDLASYDTEQKRLGVGSDGQILTADSSAPLGVKWGSAGTGLDATSIQSVPVDTAPVGALAHLKTFIAYWYSNLFLWSEDISQSAWQMLFVDISGTDGIIAQSTLTSNHYIKQDISVVLGTSYTISGEFEAGLNDFIGIRTPTTSVSILFIDLSDGSFVSKGSLIDNYAITDLGAGRYKVELNFVSDVTGTKSAFVYSSIDGTNSSYTGDDVSVYTYADKLQIKEGTITNNFPYQKTTTASISKQQLDWVDKSEITTGDTGYYETTDLKAVYVVDGLVSAISLLLDGWMEKSGVTNWTAVNNAILSKEASTLGGGVQCLRVTKNVTGFPLASQTILVSGSLYNMKGWARGDGSAGIPRVGTNNENIWTGTSSTSWQYFDVTTTNNAATSARLTNSGSGYAEFDNISVKEV